MTWFKIGLAVAAAGLMAFLWYSRDEALTENARLEVQLDEAIEAAKDNKAAYERAQESAGRHYSALTRLMRERSAGRDFTDSTIEEINNAPASDDDVAAPVLRRAFDRLRERQGDFENRNLPGDDPGTAPDP